MPFKDPMKRNEYNRDRHKKLLEKNPNYWKERNLKACVSNLKYEQEHRDERQRKSMIWHKENPEKVKNGKINYVKKIRLMILDHYGHVCINCGERNPLFLTIDHINNDGAAHRKTLGGRNASAKLYKWIIDNHYPEGFQILCYNCNCGKQRNNGILPNCSYQLICENGGGI